MNSKSIHKKLNYILTDWTNNIDDEKVVKAIKKDGLKTVMEKMIYG